MKIQDIAFIILLVALFYLRKPKYFVFAGLACLVLAMPLFHFWIFFTAQRLTYYAAAFFLASIVWNLILLRKERQT